MYDETIDKAKTTRNRTCSKGTGSKSEVSLLYIEESQPASITDNVRVASGIDNINDDCTNGIYPNDEEEVKSSSGSDVTWTPDVKRQSKLPVIKQQNILPKEHKVHFNLDNIPAGYNTSPHASVVSSTSVHSSDVGPDASIVTAFQQTCSVSN